MAIYMIKNIESGWNDITTTSTDTMTTTNYDWGICFTPKVDCNLVGVKFLNYSGTGYSAYMTIGKGDHARASGSDAKGYSLKDQFVDGYFPMSYHLEANQMYCISVYEYALRVFGINENMNFPMDLDAITINYGTREDSNNPYYNTCFCISGLKIEIPEPLHFIANTAGSTIKLKKIGSPTNVALKISNNGDSRNTYNIGDTITLTNIGDKIYFRNDSTTDTLFSTSLNDYYQFEMTGSISAKGDINYLLNKNSTDTLSLCCYQSLFRDCTSLTTCPKLTATTLGDTCYRYMFSGCSNLETLPILPAKTMISYCYCRMFDNCQKIKISTTQTGDYQTPYRMPSSGTGTTANNAFMYMFLNSGGTFTSDPSINTTYYTSNTLV